MFVDPSLKEKLLDSGRQSRHIHIHKAGPATQIYLAEYLRRQGHDAVLVLPPNSDVKQYMQLAEIFSRTSMEKDKFWESSWFFLPSPGHSSRPAWGRIWASMFGLMQQKGKAAVLTADSMLNYLPPPDVVRDVFLLLMTGEETNPGDILDKLVEWGYVRVFMVTSPGEVSQRGDILDIYAPGYPHPLRLEFFGNHLESIRTFEPVSQRSIRQLEECLILPVSPSPMEDHLVKQARDKADYLKSTGEISRELRQRLEFKLEEKDPFYPAGLFYSSPGEISEFLPEDAHFFLVDTARLRTSLEEEEWKLKQWAEAEGWPEKLFFQPEVRARTMWHNRRQVVFERLVMGQKSRGVDLGEKEINSFSDIFWKPQDNRRPWPAFLQALKEWKRTANQVILNFNTAKSRDKFLDVIQKEDIELKTSFDPEVRGLYAVVAGTGTGMHMSWNHIYILGEDVLQPGTRQRTGPTGRFKGIARVEDIEPGDMLVHRDYGLGRFGGLERISTDTQASDYLVLYYANDDKLYVPVDRFSLVQKYKGPDGADPALDKLGGANWSKTKNRVRKAIQKIAKDLVDMYAQRKVVKGYSYSPPEELYQEFANTFGFQETPDQEQAIREVMQDMESDEPMDRLVCGDVGFGKTEVAMRAAFRAVQDGKQVALLCPTTVLAEQHYQNFVQRMQDFAINVRMLSRFVPRNRQKIILEGARKGEVDILIGTHRILSQDVILPRLSLMILDEEQRFGVRHKEKLKQYRQNIDVLTLTATPIPRTLQLSVSGIRTLSVIETPPLDRKPVESSIIERDRDFLRHALQRELDRQGQVFWVYNRVQGLESVMEYVQDLMPEARVDMAHGQMPERILEENMHRFWHHEIDILVCTAIIESGLDFPRANTLIVDQAHMFGLGQLYQLRGRVGRSQEQAYAYFIVPSVRELGEKSRKRMQIILDMDYLGAGFQVAMEDLRLRGAGNILGEVQSGQIGKVGLDLFLEMMQEEVGKLKGDTSYGSRDLEINIGFSAYIPEDYIPDAAERLKYYRMLSGGAQQQDFDQLSQELQDLFGKLPEELHNFINVLKIKHALKALGPQKADFMENRLSIEWSAETGELNPEKLVQWIEKNSSIARLVPPSKLEIRLNRDSNVLNFLYELQDIVQDLTDHLKS
ncbi:transcription-repair coupling factor [Desulfonatronospira thiodismutans ASO3-1]|uniref:Transcription-repair-coupling factor n=1 Tax=Desulfonatronospira thiodismutans ASO3-1 TaxID=555779 RepID=D6SM07_9BACT|nr:MULTISPECIES: transcription-repair coupling factor [Desulfonatronospira]EFI35718.1 transcription-repair coupling factor [Desulfonatronospira thiodismutans ASO3-1]RQD76343.1 MAG: transcription-repair coupling factor [Desulfonatronospira sp. MSAO_Bac3]